MTEKILKIIEIKSRDRIVIPKEVREKLNLHTGDHMIFTEDDGGGVKIRKATLKIISGDTDGDKNGQ